LDTAVHTLNQQLMEHAGEREASRRAEGACDYLYYGKGVGGDDEGSGDDEYYHVGGE
jgi:hypothetical protein